MFSPCPTLLPMRLALFTVLLALIGCTDAQPDVEIAEETMSADSTADLSSFFPEGTVGAFVLYDAQSGITTRYNPERAAERRPPASTFKIFNSLVALDAGAVADENEIIEWDGVDRGSTGWNQSQDLVTAFKQSSVWVYRELARRVGRDTLQTWLDREDFGNATIGEEADLFWLDGSLQISPNEQIDFLRRLHAGDTGFSDRAMNTVKEIMVTDTTGGAVLRGKSGWALSETENLGWWVGWVEHGNETYFFAITVENDNLEFEMRGARLPVAERIMAHLGVR